jgi:hypothetical protein
VVTAAAAAVAATKGMSSSMSLFVVTTSAIGLSGREVGTPNETRRRDGEGDETSVTVVGAAVDFSPLGGTSSLTPRFSVAVIRALVSVRGGALG